MIVVLNGLHVFFHYEVILIQVDNLLRFIISKQKKIIKDLKERNDKLSSQYRDRDFRCIILEQRNERLQNTINDAIDCVKRLCCNGCDESKEILDILEGGGK